MPENLPELAVDDDFSSEAYQPDEEGIYRVIEYKRRDGTLYMRSTLNQLIAPGIYARATLTYFDFTGTIPLHEVNWTFQYDINRKIISKRIE